MKQLTEWQRLRRNAAQRRRTERKCRQEGRPYISRRKDHTQIVVGMKLASDATLKHMKEAFNEEMQENKESLLKWKRQKTD